MPEVGVLQLTIQDNSKQAGQGLGELADALSRIKTVAAGSFGLSAVAKEMNMFAKQVASTKSSMAVFKAISEFGDGMKKLSSVSNMTFNTDSITTGITALKTAIGDGLHLGQAGTQLNNLRLALSGQWAEDSKIEAVAIGMTNIASAASAMAAANTATVVKGVAKAITEYSSAVSTISGGGAHDYLQQQIFASTESSSATGANIGYGMQEGIESTKSAVIQAAADIAKTVIAVIKGELEISSPSKATKRLGEYTGEGLAEGIINKESEVQHAAATVAETAVKTMESALGNVTVYRMFDAATGSWREFNSETGKFIDNTKKASSGMSGYIRDIKDATTLIEKLNNPIDYSNISGFIDQVTGVSHDVEKIAGVSASVFDTPALDQDGPFKYAAEEIEFYTRLLTRAREDLDFWDKKYDETKKRIKYNGETEERTNMLRQSENAFIFSLAKIEEYEAHLQAINDHVANFQANLDSIKGTGSIQGLFEDVHFGPVLSGLQGVSAQMKMIEAVSKGTGLSIEEIKRQITELSGGAVTFDLNGMKSEIESTIADAKELKDTVAEAVAAPGEATGSAAGEMNTFADATANASTEANTFTSYADGLVGILWRLGQAVNITGGAFGNFRGVLTRMFPTLTNLIHRFRGMAVMRAMRYLIRQISQGFREGIENMYHYSQTIGSAFAPAMDQAATSLQQMKNSLGAMLAPVLQALIPVIQSVINGFITLINYVNQFFALLGGASSWTKALPVQAQAFKDTAKAAGGAGKAMKDLLADWDELNIIQSQNGGGGGGGAGSAVADYASMFTEVTEFSTGIQTIVDGIKEKFGDVMGLVKRILSILLLWKFSKAFMGVLSTLSAIAAFAGTLDIEFKLVSFFDEKFLETGDEGWLIGDILTTILGGYLGTKILSMVMTEGAAHIAIPITLAVSMLAGITTLLGDTDTSALTPEALELSAVNAIKGGALSGYLAYISGEITTGTAFKLGAASALVWLGVNIGLKATSDIFDTGEITEETIKSDFLSAGLIGAGLGLKEMILGGTLRTITGTAIGSSVFSLGVLIGLQATAQVMATNEMTADTIKDDLLSAGLVGTGIAVSDLIMVGGSAGTIVAAGGGALLTLGALITIQAIISSLPKEIKWGDYKATADEIKAFVSDSMFETAPSVTISLINATVKDLGDQKNELDKKIEAAIGTAYVMKLGLADKPLDDVVNEVNELVDAYNQTTEQAKKTLQVGMSIVPFQGTNGEQETADMISRTDERWTELNGIMADLGKELADAYKTAYDARLEGNIDEIAEQTIQKLSSVMYKIAMAISNGQARAKASEAIRTQMENLSKDSINGILDEYKKQQDELIKEMLKIRQENAEGALAQQYAYEELARYALEEAGGDVTDEAYQNYIQKAEEAHADYLKLLATMQADAEAAAQNFLEEDTANALRNYLLKLTEDYTVDIDKFKSLWGESWDETIAEIFSGTDSVLMGGNAKSNIIDTLNDYITSAFRQTDRETIKKALSTGMLKYSDFLSTTMTDQLAEELGITGDLKKVWDEYIAEILGAGETVTDTRKTIEEINDVKPELDASGITSGANEAAGAVDDAVGSMKKSLNELNDCHANITIGYNVSGGAGAGKSAWWKNLFNVELRASGGPVRSGDLVMANENGNFEMMGRMGNQPVVANNQQIVSGISQGVATANQGVENRLNTIEGLLNRILSKEFTAKAVPNSGWGAHNARSQEAYNKVTGMG